MIEFLAYLAILFSLVQLVVSLANWLFYCGIDRDANASDVLDKISILIPARNEESNISCLLNDIQQQSYKNIEILVFDDLSSDRTAEIVTEFQQADDRIRLIKSKGLPEGWLGKNYGCDTMAREATGDYFLFLDADVRVKGDVLTKAVNRLSQMNVGLLSIFPKQIMVSFGEKVTIPNMNIILLSLLPLILIRKSQRVSLAAANGQFMLFKASIYKDLKPHSQFKSKRVEDIEIARFYKQKGIGVSTLLGDDSITCRMYEGFNEAVTGFSKNVISFFGNSSTLAIMFWLITTLGILFVASTMSIYLTIGYLGVVIVSRGIISYLSKQSVFNNLLFMPLLQMSLAVFITKSIINNFKNEYQWKGRNIS